MNVNKTVNKWFLKKEVQWFKANKWGYVAPVILGRLQNLEILLEDPVTESSELVDFGAFSSPCIAESFGLIKPCIYPKFHNTITELSWLTKPRLWINLRISCMPESPRPSTTALLRTELWPILSLEFRDANPNLEEENHPLKCVKNWDHNGVVPCRATQINSGACVYIWPFHNQAHKGGRN